MSGGPGRFRRLLPLAATMTTATSGDKAARLSAAARAGLPVLPGWVVPCEQSRPALGAAVTAISGGARATARRAVLSCPLHPDLNAELTAAVNDLGGRVIVRSSSPLERDLRWSGAFSSIAEVGERDVATAVRSCWASAFAADPLERLRACGLSPEDLELGVVIQPELSPDAGGTATVTPGEVTAEAVAGHPGPLLAGWAEGVSGPALAALLGGRAARQVADLATRVFWLLGDNKIEWAIQDGSIWLLQSQASRARRGQDPAGASPEPDVTDTGDGTDERLSRREWMPLLAATVRARGKRLPGRPAVPGLAAGRLVHCRPHERLPPADADAILLVDRPLPALAPLLFGARGLIARTGAVSSHLAEVARSLAVPMVTGCQIPDESTSPPWLAVVDGTFGEVTLLPA